MMSIVEVFSSYFSVFKKNLNEHLLLSLSEKKIVTVFNWHSQNIDAIFKTKPYSITNP